MKAIFVNVGNNIRTLRKAQKISQIEFAEKVGIAI